MKEELYNFYKRFNIENNNEENKKRFKNALNRILTNYIGNISLKPKFRDEFIKNTGIDDKDFERVDANTEIDFGQGNSISIIGKRYIQFSNTCIGRAFQTDITSILKYLQVVFLMEEDIVPAEIKERIKREINDISDIFGINFQIIKTKDKYLVYPKGAEELDDKLVNDNLNWLDTHKRSQEAFISALEKYQRNDDLRNILDDLRLSLEILIQELVQNNKSLEHNKSELGNYLKTRGINKEISNMYMILFDYYSKYQNNNVKHSNTCYTIESEFIIYLTGNFMRLLMLIEQSSE